MDKLDITIVHEWLDAGGDPDTLRDWIDSWERENEGEADEDEN